jgi:hypothetical protein
MVYRRAGGSDTPAENAKRDFAADSLAVHIKELQQESLTFCGATRVGVCRFTVQQNNKHKDQLLVLVAAK